MLILALACTSPNSLAPPEPGHQPIGFATALARLDSRIGVLQGRVAAQPTDWVTRAQLVESWRHRARLSGDYSDYARADDELSAAFAGAVAGSGPFLTRARLDYALHRLDGVADDLDAEEARTLVGLSTQAELATLRANLHWQQGAISDTGFLFSLSLLDTPGAHAGLAQHYAFMGELEVAEAELDQFASFFTDGETLAWAQLQRGIFDLGRGRLEEALAHYEAADRAFPGYWLIEEHRAEALYGLGEVDEALAIWHHVEASTGHPQFQDALATAYAELGAVETAASWSESAHAGWLQRLDTYPEATWGHGIAHFLERDPATALSLARDNLAVRPHPQGHLWHAQGWLALDHPEQAWQALQPALDSDWVSGDLHATEAEILEALGWPAAAAWERARAINPRL